MQGICARAASHMRCSSSSHAAHMRWSPSSPRGSKLSGNLTGEIYLVIICYPFDLLFRFAEAFADHYRGSLSLRLVFVWHLFALRLNFHLKTLAPKCLVDNSGMRDKEKPILSDFRRLVVQNISTSTEPNCIKVWNK